MVILGIQTLGIKTLHPYAIWPGGDTWCPLPMHGNPTSPAVSLSNSCAAVQSLDEWQTRMAAAARLDASVAPGDGFDMATAVQVGHPL